MEGRGTGSLLARGSDKVRVKVNFREGVMGGAMMLEFRMIHLGIISAWCYFSGSEGAAYS